MNNFSKKGTISNLPNIVSKHVEVFIYINSHTDYKFLLLKRCKTELFPGIWSIAGGEINEGEKAYAAAIREMQEETGLRIKRFFVFDQVNLFYNSETDQIQLFPVFLAEAGNGKVKLSKEHSEYKWVNYKKAYKNLHWISWKENITLINKMLHSKNLFKALTEIKI